MANDSSKNRLELLYQISRELVSSLDLDHVLQRVLELSTGNVNAERGNLIALDEYANPVSAAIYYQQKIISHDAEQVRKILEDGLAGWVLRNREAVVILDTFKDTRWLKRSDDDLDKTGAKSAVCLPIMVADQLTGVMTIVHPAPGFFTQEHLDFLQAIADQAGTAIRNAVLYDQLQSMMIRYRELFEDNINPVLITNNEGRINEANKMASQLLELSKRELSKKTIEEIVKIDHSATGGSLEKIRESTDTISFETDLIKLNIPVEVFVKKVDYGSGSFYQWILHDISARKELESLRNDLTAMVYHDLRSPLSNVISSLDMLEILVPADRDENIQQVFDIASRSTERVKRLASSLLDIYRLEAGQKLIQPGEQHLRKLVEDSVEVIRNAVLQKNINVEIFVPDDLPYLFVDEDMIKRVFVNLLENASRFTPEHGTIRISAEVKEKMIEVRFFNDGPDIPVEIQEKIFDKLQQFSIKKSRKGIGLGLAFCRLAVESHGGEIWVDSEKGKGATFLLTLPMVHL